MTRPANVTIADEILSLKLYLSRTFPTDEIRHFRPDEDEPYTMLIEPPEAVISNQRGKYLSERAMPLTIQRWCDSYMQAADYVERLEVLFRKGEAPGNRSRVPVWKWVDEQTPPDMDNDVPDRFLKVADVDGRILPGEKVGTHIAILDVRLLGWRIVHTYSDTLIQTVNKARVNHP